MRKELKRTFAARIGRKIFNLIYPLNRSRTIAEGWERYARRHIWQGGGDLGSEWTRPEQIGIDLPADKIFSYVDEHVFSPFLGTCETLLEIGSGGGRFTEILLPKCHKLIASDTSPTMLKLLRKRFPGESKIECLLLDGRGLSPLRDHSIDRAFSWGVFVHLQHWDIYNYLRELKRVLKPGGKAIIQHPNTFSDLGWKHFLGELSASLNRPKLPTTFSLFTPEIMKEFTRRAGLELADCLIDVIHRDGISLIISPEN